MFNKYSLTLLALFFSVPVYAAAPLITDDTGTQGKGKYQIELDYAAGVTTTDTGQELSTTLSRGIVDNVDVVVGLPYNWNPFTEEGRPIAIQQGIGDMAVDIKWRFLDNSKENGLSLALKPGVTLPTGNAKRGLGNGEISEGVMLIATEEWQHGAFHCNIGYTNTAYSLEENTEALRKGLWHASLGTEVNMMKNLRTVADIGVDTNTVKASTTHPVYIIGGVIYSVNEHLDLDIGFKGGLNNTAPQATFLAGMTTKF